MRSLFAVVALAAVPALAVPAPESERLVAPRYDCSNCRDQGLVACRKCVKLACPGKVGSPGTELEFAL